MPRGYKITPNFDTLSKTINLLGSELGNVIKDQAGAKYFKIVEDIRLNSKKYRQTNNNKYLDSIFKTLQSLEPNEIYIITKAFTIFFYLSNIAEQVFREHTLKNSNISINKKTNNELIFMPVFTAHPTESSRQSTLKKIYKIEREYIVMCPTNSKYHKRNHRGYRAWPLKNWQELIDKILLKTSLDVVVTGHSSEEEFINQLNLTHSRVHNLCGKTSIPNLVEIMKNSVCAIANDSGAVHVAGVSCQKVVALHGPTPFKETGPYGSGSNKIIEANINMKCSPCYNTDAIKKCPSNLCMINLTADMVFDYAIK